MKKGIYLGTGKDKKLREITVNGVKYVPDKPLVFQAFNFVGGLPENNDQLMIYVDDGKKKKVVILKRV